MINMDKNGNPKITNSVNTTLDFLNDDSETGQSKDEQGFLFYVCERVKCGDT